MLNLYIYFIKLYTQGIHSYTQGQVKASQKKGVNGTKFFKVVSENH